MTFEWDSAKARRNLRKHGISFEEAMTVFRNPLAQSYDDPDGLSPEQRSITMGLSDRHKLLVVVHCERGDGIRIISARRAMRREVRSYEEG